MKGHTMPKALIIAPSGSGKSASMRNLDPEKSVVIQVIKKDLPFKNGKNWAKWKKGEVVDGVEAPGSGSRITIIRPPSIMAFMDKAVAAGKKIIIVDDLVYAMAGKVMDDADEKGYEKWTLLAKEIWEVMKHPDTYPDDVRVYFMSHTEEDQNGLIKMKTAGKLLDNLVTPEGMFSTVLGATMQDGKYFFKTQKERNSEPFKSPMEMFDSILIENDLKLVDDTFVEYYDIKE